MHLSYAWLERHIDLGGRSAEEIKDSLTMYVAEVEGVERFAPVLDDVVVGFVQERRQHPNADRLSVCRVDVGEAEPLQIVCGAPNVDAGQKVAVARVGCVLPGDFEIKKAKIRGEASQGMICSEKELGLGEDHAGIWVLPETDAAPGTPVSEALGGPDWVFEVDNKSITHRPDLWGHRGFARELAALWGTELKPLDTTMPPTGDGEPFPLRIDSANCSRYVAVPVDGVRAERSPDWLRLLLLAAGQRPIDLLVDLSNFVMLDLGQPNHLFDRSRVSAGIEVRDARPGETMDTLDGIERRLEPGDVLICSGDEPVALGGIMGGEASKVGKDTDRLLLEVAAFDAVAIRRTSSRLGLRTDASARFEKSLDPTLPGRAAAHLLRLLADMQPDMRLPSPATDIGDWEDPSHELSFRPERARKVLGIAVSDEAMRDTLSRLGFEVDAGEGAGHESAGDAVRWRVGVPSYRATKDVTIEEDLIEEVGRLYGFDNIPEEPIYGRLAPVLPDRRAQLVDRAKDFLSGAPRFHEVYSYSFVDADLVEVLGEAELPHTEVVNAIAHGLDRLRRGVLPSLLGKVEHNLRHRDELRLFEIGKGSIPEERDAGGKPAEVHEIALVWAGEAPEPGARFDARRIFHLKGLIEQLMHALDLPAVAWAEAEAPLPGWANPGRAMRPVLPAPDPGVAGDDAGTEAVGLLAELDPRIARGLGVKGDIACAVLSLDRLSAYPETPTAFRPLPRYPGVKIDVALKVNASVRSEALVSAIHAAAGKHASQVELFDLYQGEPLAEDEKSLAYHVLLSSDEGTLTDEDGQRFLERLEREVEALGAELRRP